MNTVLSSDKDAWHRNSILQGRCSFSFFILASNFEPYLKLDQQHLNATFENNPQRMENTIQLESTKEQEIPCEGKFLIKSIWQLKIQLF